MLRHGSAGTSATWPERRKEEREGDRQCLGDESVLGGGYSGHAGPVREVKDCSACNDPCPHVPASGHASLNSSFPRNEGVRASNPRVDSQKALQPTAVIGEGGFPEDFEIVVVS